MLYVGTNLGITVIVCSAGPVLGYPVQGVITVIHSVCVEPGTSLAMVSACVSRCMLKVLSESQYS